MYVKLLAPDQLLLSEAVCCKLGIVTYHPSIQSVQGCCSAATPKPISSNVSDSNTVLYLWSNQGQKKGGAAKDKISGSAGY